jgi:hypothetical protein
MSDSGWERILNSRRRMIITLPSEFGLNKGCVWFLGFPDQGWFKGLGFLEFGQTSGVLLIYQN